MRPLAGIVARRRPLIECHCIDHLPKPPSRNYLRSRKRAVSIPESCFLVASDYRRAFYSHFSYLCRSAAKSVISHGFTARRKATSFDGRNLKPVLRIHCGPEWVRCGTGFVAGCRPHPQFSRRVPELRAELLIGLSYFLQFAHGIASESAERCFQRAGLNLLLNRSRSRVIKNWW